MASIIEIRPGIPVEEVARICNRNFKSVLTENASSSKTNQQRVDEKIDDAVDGINEAMNAAIDEIDKKTDEAIAEANEAIAETNDAIDNVKAEADKALADVEKKLVEIEQKYQSMLDDLEDKLEQEIAGCPYAVGDILQTFNDANPSKRWANTTWEQITDRFVYAAGSEKVSATGGEATHKLTTSEMPSHTHSATTSSAGNHTHQVGLDHTGAYGSSEFTVHLVNAANGNTMSGYQNWGYTSSSGSHTHTLTVSSTGSGTAHNNMPPYIVAYMWKRTA